MFVEDLNIPYDGLRRYNDSLLDQMGSWAYLRSTSPTSVSNSYSRVFFVFANALGTDDLARGYAVPLRCFSNEYIPYTVSFTLKKVCKSAPAGRDEPALIEIFVKSSVDAEASLNPFDAFESSTVGVACPDTR